MSHIRGHRASDAAGDAKRAAAAGARYAALTLIVICLVVWVWNRPWGAGFEALTSSDRISDVVVRAGLQPTGRFQEQFTGLEGVEVARANCPAPLAILPVAFGTLELPPDALSYRDGEHDVVYAFDGDLYPETWISYRLRITSIWRRLASIVSRSDRNSLHYYMKIWTARGCDGLTQREVERLRDADR